MSDSRREVGERLRKAREKANLKQNRVAKMLGIHNSTLSKYESGEREPDNETMIKFSELYGENVEYLVTGKRELTMDSYRKYKSAIETGNLKSQHAATLSKSNVIDISPLVEIPIYGEIKAGYDMIADQNIIGYQIVARDDVKDGEYFYLLVRGDSMIEDGIFEGSRVLVRRQNHVEHGKIAVVLTNGGEEATLKRVFYDGDNVILQPANRNMQPKTYPIHEVYFQGQVKSYTVDV